VKSQNIGPLLSPDVLQLGHQLAVEAAHRVARQEPVAGRLLEPML
jgi:hypothetical protein